MELRTAGTPVPAIPLGDARDHVPVVLDLFVASQRQLPAHLGLERDVALVIIDRHHVQRTARASMEVGTVEKDARVFNDSRRDLAVLLDSGRAGFSLGLELPLIVRQAFGRFFDPTLILFVSEVRAVAAAALDELGRGPVRTPWQPLPKMQVQLLSRKVTSNIQVRSRFRSSKLIHSWASLGIDVTFKRY